MTIEFVALTRGTGMPPSGGLIAEVQTLVEPFNIVLYPDSDPDRIVDLTDDFVLEFPANLVKLVSIQNLSGFTATLKVQGQDASLDQELTHGTIRQYYLNGQHIIAYSAGSSGPSISGITVEDEGTGLDTPATTLDFVGEGVTATGSGSTKTITIPGGGSDEVVVKVFVTGNAYVEGELVSMPRGDVYIAQREITAGSANSRVNPNDATNDLWEPIQGYVGAWNRGGHYREGNLVEHSGRIYFALQRVSNSQTSPDSDTTNFQLVGNQNLTDSEIGERAFENPPTLNTTQQAAVRTAIGAGPGRTLDDLPIPEWAARGGYAEGELVRDPHNRVFMCITTIAQSNNAPATDATHFTQVTAYAGDYADSTAYPVGELVTHSGDVYFVGTAVAATNTDDPSSNTAFVLINGTGTSVEANPAGSADGGNLTKIEIDGTIYDIPAGGDSGSTPEGLTEVYDSGASYADVATDTWVDAAISPAVADTDMLIVAAEQRNGSLGAYIFQNTIASVPWSLIIESDSTATTGPANIIGTSLPIELLGTLSVTTDTESSIILRKRTNGSIRYLFKDALARGRVRIYKAPMGGSSSGSGGTTVEANPSGAVDSGALTKLSVDGSIYSVAAGSGGGLTSVETDATLTGDGTSGDALSVANPFTAADEAVVDAIVQDVVLFWLQSAQHAAFDAVGPGDVIDINYGTGNADTAQATVRSISRATNVAKIVIDPLTVWSAIVGGNTVIIEDASNNTIGSWQTAGLQTTRAGVTSFGDWWRQERAPGAGADVWEEIDRIDALDDTHLTIGTRTGTTLEIASSTGDNVIVPSASGTQAGLESAADKTQLLASPPVWATATAYDAGVQRMWQGLLYECIVARTIADTDNPATDITGWAPVTATGTTDLSVGTRTGTTMVVESSSGSNVTLPVATTSDAGLESAADKAKTNALPDNWSAKVWSAGEQCTYSNVIYICLVDRTAADSDTPDNDTSSWAPVTGDQDLSGYVTTTALAAYSNTNAMNTAIANAIANLDALVDKGAWNTTDSFDEHDLVRHSGASYIALGSVNAGIEPGVTSGWATSWYRLAYSDGPPTALTTPRLVGGSLDFPSIGGQRTQIKLPSGTETPYSYYVAPTISVSDSTTNQAISDSGDGLEITLVDDETFSSEGIQAGADFITEWAGSFSFRFSAAATVQVSLVTEHTFNSKSITHVRTIPVDVLANASVGFAMNAFTRRSRIALGTYQGVTITEADLEGNVQISYKLRFQAFGRRSTTRLTGNLTEIFFSGLDTVAYQLGAFQGSVDTAPATRAERVTFQAIANGTGGVEGTPVSTDGAVSVVFPENGERTLITALNNNDITLKAGVYLVSFTSTITGANNNSRIIFEIRDSNDDSSIGESTSPHIGTTPQTASAYTEILLNEDTTVNVFVRRFSASSALAANWTATFTRWGGSNSFDPSTLGVDTFPLTGAQQDIALTDDTSGNAIVCPETGWLLVESLIPGIGLNNKVDWYSAARLRADKTAGDGLYTNAAHEIILRVAAHEGGATTGNVVRIFYTGATTAGSITPPPVITPHIRTWRVTGDQSVPAGSIQGKTYNYESQISQSSHVAAARVVGFIGTEGDPSSVTQLHVITDYSDETGTLTLPNVTLTADQIYTLRLEVYETGKTFIDTPTLYADYRITAVATALRTHFGYILASQDETDVEASGTDISTSADAAGSYTVALPAQPPNTDYRMFWRVPTANTQPTAFTTAGFAFTSTIEVVENVTINGASYTVYMTEQDSPFDNSANGTILVVT